MITAGFAAAADDATMGRPVSMGSRCDYKFNEYSTYLPTRLG